MHTPVLSRAGDVWSGATGYVQDALLAEKLNMDDVVVYACGSETMIHSSRAALVNAGLPETQFNSDAFVSSS